jgi:proteasome accessory factor A
MNKRIYGLETEYALLFYPDNPGSPTPNQKHIYELFSEVLQEQYVCAPAHYRKQGLFLANSLLLHYEARGDSYYQGMIEGCTPECLSPKELLVYQRVLDDTLKDLVTRTQERLAERGFLGRLVIGKNSIDTHGNSYGCHENYLIEDPVYRPLWVIYPLLVLTVLAIGVPIVWVLAATFVFLLSIYFCAVAGKQICRFLSRLPGIGWAFGLLETVWGLPIKVVERVPETEWLKIVNYVMQFAFLLPVTLLSKVLSWTTFRAVRRSLTSFVVTRTIFSGSGSLAFDEDAPGLHLSQKADAIRSVMKIFWDDDNKPIFDIKNFIFEITSALKSFKRLHILYSDSNMSEVSQYLKIGATGLVLKMIEAGTDFGHLELRSPVKALHKVSRFGHGALLKLRNGQQKSALQVQREYLAAAHGFVAQGLGITEEDRLVVMLWEDILEQLDKNPMGLGMQLDWVIKKRMMDEFILERTNWLKFSQWGRIIQKLREMTGGEVNFSDWSFDSLRQALSERQFRTLSRMATEDGLNTEEFQLYCDLFFEIKKLDLRYHEISSEGGYYEWLEQNDMVKRLTRPDELEIALKLPPPYTRANIRGHYVAWSAKQNHDVVIGWRKIRDRTLRRTIYMDDPFEHEIEGEG